MKLKPNIKNLKLNSASRDLKVQCDNLLGVRSTNSANYFSKFTHWAIYLTESENVFDK